MLGVSISLTLCRVPALRCKATVWMTLEGRKMRTGVSSEVDSTPSNRSVGNIPGSSRDMLMAVQTILDIFDRAGDEDGPVGQPHLHLLGLGLTTIRKRACHYPLSAGRLASSNVQSTRTLSNGASSPMTHQSEPAPASRAHTARKLIAITGSSNPRQT